MTLKQPINNLQEVLYTLIEQGHVSIMDYPYLSGFRTRISELINTYGVFLQSEPITKKNKFGNSFTYNLHRLLNREQAIIVYNKLTEKQ